MTVRNEFLERENCYKIQIQMLMTFSKTKIFAKNTKNWLCIYLQMMKKPNFTNVVPFFTVVALYPNLVF